MDPSTKSPLGFFACITKEVLPVANKPKKKPRHTNLVLPGEKKKPAAAAPPEGEKDRLGRAVSAPATAPPATKAFDLETSEVPSQSEPSTPAQTPTVEELLERGSAPAPPVEKPAAAAKPQPPAPAPGKPAESNPPKDDKKPKENRKAKKRFKRKTPLRGTRTKPAQGKPAEGSTKDPGEEDDLPENAIRLPRTGPRFTAVRRKKVRRRVGVLVVALLIVAAIFIFISGLHLHIGMALRDATDSLRIALTAGDGYPASFNLPGYISAESMGSRGFAALGEKDFYMYSSGGVELTSVQHGYTSPGMSAGNTRACLYNRGGREYTIESRGDTLARRTTNADILFAELSPSGWLALVTTSRYNVSLQVFNSVYDVNPELKWDIPLIDAMPVLATFHPDNRTVALGCLEAEGGGLNTVVRILRVGQEEVQATIEVPDARLLRAEYISSSRLLLVFDTHTALYNTQGEEIARYDYGGRQFMASSTGDGRTALILGSTARESLDLVLLDSGLTELFSTAADSASTPRVLATPDGVFLLLGQEVLAYTDEGALSATHTLSSKAQDLVWSGQPLALCSGVAEPLDWMLENAPDGSSSRPQPASTP